MSKADKLDEIFRFQAELNLRIGVDTAEMGSSTSAGINNVAA